MKSAASSHRDQERLLREAIGIVAAPAAQGACHGGGHRAADAAGRHLQHQHRQREHQRNAGQRVGPDPAEDEAVVADDHRHGEQADDVGRGEAEQRRQQRRLQHLPRAGRLRSWRRRAWLPKVSVVLMESSLSSAGSDRTQSARRAGPEVDRRLGRQAELDLRVPVVGQDLLRAGFQSVEGASHDHVGSRLGQVDAAGQVGVDEAHVHAEHLGVRARNSLRSPLVSAHAADLLAP